METLGHYADWLEIPTQEIRRLNHFPFRRRISARERIEIPFGKVGRELFEERRYEFHKEVEEDFFAAYEVTAVDPYTVRRGDNIWTLCQETFQLPLWLISRFNPGLDIERLRPGRRIKVPVVRARTEEAAAPAAPGEDI